jgi:dipeptidyl aminopeptidase/acylaminoacyl peptidase
MPWEGHSSTRLTSTTTPTLDTKRTAIRDGSSGGYTTLAYSSASKTKIFASATSNYGISNLELLADDTHTSSNLST